MFSGLILLEIYLVLYSSHVIYDSVKSYIGLLKFLEFIDF